MTSIEVGDETSPPVAPAPEVHGYVDLSGWVETVPPPIPAGMLVPYADEASARRALKEGEIAGFYVIPADYIASGELISIRPDYSPLYWRVPRIHHSPPSWLLWSGSR